MTGRLNGVAARLKRHSPRMISVHCVEHRLALAAAHASVFTAIYVSPANTFFYQNSAVRMANLNAIQEILDDPSIKCRCTMAFT